MRIFGDIVWKEFQRDETVQASVFRLVDNAHSATTDFGHDAVA